MKTLKIEIPEGFEIDEMDAKTGTVSFKETKASYPTNINELKSGHRYYIGSLSRITKMNSTNDSGGNYVGSSELNLSDTKEEAEAFLALMQLKRLCNSWNKVDVFVPKFNDTQSNYCIEVYDEKLDVVCYSSTQSTLAFKSVKTAKLFVETFADLLETAKPLL